MDEPRVKERLAKLFRRWNGNLPETISALPVSGSERSYYRLERGQVNVIGAFNEDVNENRAFFHLTEIFKSKKLNVPGVFIIDREKKAYLQEDLGDLTLFDMIGKGDKKEGPGPEASAYYATAVESLVDFQTGTLDMIDTSMLYPKASFDRQAMLWDLNYFKYNFLKLAGIGFREHLLEEDFDVLVTYLEGAGSNYFMYRDFQARNIMIHNGSPWFIDYQGGRKGPLQYDLASLLFQARASLPAAFREEMLEKYLSALPGNMEMERRSFRPYFFGFALMRLLQVMGAYGFRGLYQKKPHFMESLRHVFSITEELLRENYKGPSIPEIRRCIALAGEKFAPPEPVPAFPSPNRLTVTINSFSYKKGMPQDTTEHGGGFVFDCRALPNPGRNKYYQDMTGNDPEVVEFLEKHPEVENFLESTFSLADRSVENYLERDFSNLMINFGCTGGRHRSVYCAERMGRHLAGKYPAEIIIKHREV